MLDTKYAERMLTQIKDDDKTIILINENVCELDALLADYKELELASNGIKADLNLQILEPRIEINWDAETFCLEQIGIIESIFSAYNNWELQRDRFLTGRAGTFFDFGELASVITDFVRAFDCITYAEVYNKMCDCVDKFTTSEDVNNPFYDILYNKEREWVELDKQIADPNIMFKITAVSSLRSSNRFTPYHLSYIIYKLRKFVEFESKVSECVAKIMPLCK